MSQNKLSSASDDMNKNNDLPSEKSNLNSEWFESFNKNIFVWLIDNMDDGNFPNTPSKLEIG